MLDLLSKYSPFINSFRITDYEHEGNSFRFKARIEFADNSTLFIKEYVFENNERKYSYHWVASAGNLICRWDNSDHWPNIHTFPHHKHIGENVFESTEISIDDILRIICDKLQHAAEST
jgi:hypothetical protein